MTFEKTIPDSHLTKDKDQVLETQMVVDHLNPAQKSLNQPAQMFEDIEQKARDLFDKNLFDSVIHLLNSLHVKKVGTETTYCLLASAYHQKNAFKQARENYEKALELNPDHVESLLNLSVLKLDLGDYKRGFLSFNRAHSQSLVEKEVSWKSYVSKQHFHLANTYYDKGYYHEALLEFLKVYSDTTYAESLDVQLRIIRCLWKLDRRSEAMNKISLLKKAYPHSTEISLLIGYFYFKMSKLTQAINEWESVLEQDPHNPKAKQYLSDVEHIQNVEENSFA